MEEEDYPGQNDGIRRNQIIQQAVESVNRIILDGSEGSAEETDYLTGAITMKLMSMIHGRLSSQLLAYDFKRRNDAQLQAEERRSESQL